MAALASFYKRRFKLKKILAIVLGIVIFLVIVGGLYLATIKPSKPKLIGENLVAATNKQVVITPAKKVETKIEKKVK